MMANAQGPWRGTGPTLDAAFQDAWNAARMAGAQPDTEYKVEISIIGLNPIHTYVVVIGP